MLKTRSRVEPELEYQIESIKSLLWIPLIQVPLHPTFSIFKVHAGRLLKIGRGKIVKDGERHETKHNQKNVYSSMQREGRLLEDDPTALKKLITGCKLCRIAPSTYHSYNATTQDNNVLWTC